MSKRQRKMKKLVFIFLGAIVLCCCTPAGKQPTVIDAQRPSVSADAQVNHMNEQIQDLVLQYQSRHDPHLLDSAMRLNDSIESLDTTEQGHFYAVLTRIELLTQAGKIKEAMRLQESILNPDPNNLVRLQFYAGKHWLEGNVDSARHYANRALEVCDKELADSLISTHDAEQALTNKLLVYQLMNDRIRAKEVSDRIAKLHPDDPTYDFTDDDFNAEFNEARETLKQAAEAWKRDTTTYVKPNSTQ